MAYTNTPLFGDAITVDLPLGFADASQIRQIPDHQEVYLDARGYSSIVIEILEYVSKPSDAEALQYHFADLVDSTGDATTILSQSTAQINSLPSHPLLTLSFIQTPPAGTAPGRKTPEFTFIYMMLLRLKEKGTDILVTVNVPHYLGEYEGTAEQGGTTKLMESGRKAAERMVETFEIKNWGLFDV